MPSLRPSQNLSLVILVGNYWEGGSITTYYYLVRSRDNQLWLKGSTLNANIGWQQRWEMPCGILGNASRYESNGVLDICYICIYTHLAHQISIYSFPIGVKSDWTRLKPRHEKGTETTWLTCFLKLQDHEIKSRFLLEIIILPGEVAKIPPNVPPDSPVCPPWKNKTPSG